MSRRRRPARGLLFAILPVLALAGYFLAGSGGSASAAGTAAPAVAALRIGGNDFAAGGDLSHYGYIIMHASEWARIPTLRAANPSVKLIAYEDMSLSTDWSCHNGVDDPFPASGLGYCATNTAHPDWFLTDTTGSRVESAWYAGDWFMDVGSSAYQNAWASTVISALRAKGFDGVMLDDANSDPSGHLGGRTLAKYPTIQSYRDATTSFLQNVCAQVHTAGFLALPNIDASAPRAVRDQWARTCDGSVKEYWVKWGTSTSLQKTGADWLAELAQIDDADTAGKIILPITYGPTGDTRDMTFARASFLLAWNGSSPSALIWDIVGADSWSPAWTAAVGTPSGPRFQVSGGVWRRDFTGGVALVNPDPAATVTVALGGTFTDASGAPVTSVTLAPATGAILSGAQPPLTTTATTTTPVATTTSTQTVSTQATTATTPTTTVATTTSATTTTSPTTTTAPPPSSPPATTTLTLGKTGQGSALTGGQPADSKTVNRAVLDGAGDLSKIRAFLAGAGGKYTEAVRGVVYADAGGAPGQFRGTTSPIWVSATASRRWFDLPFATPLHLTAGAYWIGLQFGGWTRLVRVGYDAGASGTARTSVDAWADGPSWSFGAASGLPQAWAVYGLVTSTPLARRALSVDQRAAATKSRRRAGKKTSPVGPKRP